MSEVSKQGFGNEELIKKDALEGTPFHVVTIGDESFGVMGEYRLTEKKSDRAEIIEELEVITWNRLVQVMMIMNEVKEKLTNKINKK